MRTSTPSRSAARFGRRERSHVEADDDRVGGRGEHHVGLVDAARLRVDDVDRDLFLRDFRDLVLERLQGAGDIGLEDDVELLDVALLDAREDLLEADLAGLTAGQGLGLEPVGPFLRELAGVAVVLDGLDELAGVGDAVEAEHLDRHPGPGALDPVADEVVHRPHPTPLGTGDERVADLEGPALDQDADDGAAAGVELGLDHGPGGLRVGVGAELLELGDQQDHVEQVLEAFVGLGGDVAVDGVPTPVLGVRPSAASSLRTRSGWAPSLSILLTAIRIGTSAARAWSIASLVCGITPSSAATTTTAMSVTLAPRARIAVKAAWPGRVEEGDRLLLVVDLVGADVLGDAAGLARGDLGLADRIEQRGLAVVDVAHDRHHRRAVLEVSSASSNSGSSGSSSAAVTISILRSYSSAIAFTESSVRVCVSVAISPIIISFLITSAAARPSNSATSRTVAPDWTLTASGSAGVSDPSGGSSSSGLRRRPPRRLGGRCGGGPPICSRRAACESITTRRFFADAAATACACWRRGADGFG